MLNISAFSDTHEEHLKIKIEGKHAESDLLICGGDFSSRKSDKNYIKKYLNWFSEHPNKYKILIGGNHDFFIKNNNKEFRGMIPKDIIYLENESITIDGYKIFGSPNVPNLKGWAFSEYDENLKYIYDKIPNDTDILLTHTPPFEILDLNSRGKNCGSISLKNRIEDLKITLNLFGHIHHSGGNTIDLNNITFSNISVYNNEPIGYFQL